MIKSFKDKETEKVYGRDGSRKLPEDIQQAALRKLCMINPRSSLLCCCGEKKARVARDYGISRETLYQYLK